MPMKKIFLFSFGLALVVTSVSGQTIKAKKHQVSNITIGFNTGASTVFKAPVIYKPNPRWNNFSSLTVKKDLNKHIAISTGVDYSNNISLTKHINKQTAVNTISIPTTVQYYLLPTGKRFRPYVGAGVSYNIIKTGFNGSNYQDAPIGQCCLQNGTKYISIIATQGVMFEINTKIQINESIHFMPSNQANIIGVNVGMGYKL
jgi:outer membrane protein W